MRSKNKPASISATQRGAASRNEERRREARRRLWLRVGALFMAIVFLASECSSLILLE